MQTDKKADKAHLVYLTGLSMDKKRLNYITENINADIDFSYWFDKVRRDYLETLEVNKSSIVEELQNNVNIIKIITDKVIQSKFSANHKELQKYIKPLLSDILDAKRASFSFNSNLTYNFDELLDSMGFVSTAYPNGDFFSLYLSHQSDSVAVAPLAKISSVKNFNIINSYCDRPYYDNKYIDHIILKIDKELIPNDKQESFKDFAEANFYTHILDTLLSKVISDAKTNGLSYYDIVEGGLTWRNLQDIQASLSERNFYGITLLSMFFYNLEKFIGSDSLAFSLDMNNPTKQEFLKELIVSAANPTTISFSTSAKIETKIYFANGLHLEESIEELSKDKFFTSIVGDEVIDNQTVSFESIDNTKQYIDEDATSFYIKIPIKMVLSLPMNENEQVDSSLVIPYGIDSKSNDVVDLITVGGAEHNRALAHLINKHRLHYKDERILGFMDNKYDFVNKVKYIDDENYEESFIMGLNQPVAGYNAIFSTRKDDDKGESSNINTKLLGYRLQDNDKIYNIITIYGFSALASVFGIHYVVSEIDKKSNFDTETLLQSEIDEIELISKGVFHSKYLGAFHHNLDAFSSDNIKYINKGLSALIVYQKDANSKLNQNFKKMLPLYVFNANKELYKNTFLTGTKESLIDKIYTGRNTTKLK